MSIQSRPGKTTETFTLAVQQSFGNSPQYIQLRDTLEHRAQKSFSTAVK